MSGAANPTRQIVAAAKAPVQTPATDPTANDNGRTLPVMKYMMVSPTGAENECDTTAMSSKPCALTHWVPAQPEMIAIPTTTALPIDLGSPRIAAEDSAPAQISSPIAMPIPETGIPVSIAR